jgi:hypothetical protein
MAAFHAWMGIVLGGWGKNRYFGGDMTRSSIELSIKIFLLCLVAVFIYTVTKVIGMIS